MHKQILKEWKGVHLKINVCNKFQGDIFGWELGEEPEQNPILRKQNKANKQASKTHYTGWARNHLRMSFLKMGELTKKEKRRSRNYEFNSR